MPGPLDGIRVLDLSTIILGPTATQIMGDMGADVIKVEPPEGDGTRQLGPMRNANMGAVYLGCNRNKRSAVLDLKRPEARDALLRLVETADVFLHAMRPQAIERLGLTYDEVAAVNPRIVYCGTYGYRASGPYGRKPAYDDMIQAGCGLAGLFERRDGQPAYVPNAVADKVSGLVVVYALSMALFHRERTGEGQAVEVPMFESMVAFTMAEHLYGRYFDPPMGGAGYPRQVSPGRRPYPTKDGYVGVLPFSDKQWKAVFELAGRPDLAEDPRFGSLTARGDNIDALYAELETMMTARTTAEWVDEFDAANVPAMPVHAVDAVLDDEHLAATGFFRPFEHETEGPMVAMDLPVHFSRSPGAIRRGAPRLGQHTAEVLREAGLGEAEIEALTASGAAVVA